MGLRNALQIKMRAAPTAGSRPVLIRTWSSNFSSLRYCEAEPQNLVGTLLLLHETGRFLILLYDWAKVSNESRLCPLLSLAAGLIVPRP